MVYIKICVCVYRTCHLLEATDIEGSITSLHNYKLYFYNYNCNCIKNYFKIIITIISVIRIINRKAKKKKNSHKFTQNEVEFKKRKKSEMHFKESVCSEAYNEHI